MVSPYCMYCPSVILSEAGIQSGRSPFIMIDKNQIEAAYAVC
jgi:hypothetical protein